MNNYDVVRKLIGDIRPRGDASRDYQILDNLKAMCELHSEIHNAISEVAYDFRDDNQGSVKMCCDFANNYINNIGLPSDYWEARCKLAERIIDETPCDPDITKNQTEAWDRYKEYLKAAL